MIRYRVTEKQMKAAAEKAKPGWLAAARKRTTALVKLGKFDEASSIWSQIKPAFRALQGDKCAYCERLLEEFAIEHDVEHYRPKSAVTAWPKPADAKRLGITFPTGGGWETGYYWLAYQLKNYATACKSCNSTLKGTGFPIAGKRGKKLQTVEKLTAEKPLLIFPVGTWGDDPARLLTFDGITITPVATRGPNADRGWATIHFFRLNRARLRQGRAKQIYLLWHELEDSGGARTPAKRAAARDRVKYLLSNAAEHSACARAFHSLWQSDHDRAEVIFEKCRDWVINKSNA